MEWVETTARTVEEAKERALDQLGVVADEAEFDVLEEPRPGLFGRIRGEARVRARVRPAPARPKQDRRRQKRDRRSDAGDGREEGDTRGARAGRPSPTPATGAPARPSQPPTPRGAGRPPAGAVTTEDRSELPPPSVDEVRGAAEEFVRGLTAAFGFDATVTSVVEDNEIEVRVDGAAAPDSGQSLGLLIGPGGRTLLGVQDLARVAAQRRLGDHETRLRIDIAGYRERRRVALERFAASVAEQVRTTGVARSLDPMPSADRKVVHDALAEIDGVTSRSEGEEPYRRIVVSPD